MKQWTTWTVCFLVMCMACTAFGELTEWEKLSAEGVACFNSGDYAAALELHQKALALAEKTMGTANTNTATSLNNLAEVYRLQRQYDKAEPLQIRALEIRKKQLGLENPDTATSMINLGLIYRARGEYDKAEPLYLQALAIDEKAYGPDRLEVAVDLNNLAVLYHVQSQFDKAEPLYQRALAIREKALGLDHPLTKSTRANMAAFQEARSKSVTVRQGAASDSAETAPADEYAQSRGQWMLEISPAEVLSAFVQLRRTQMDALAEKQGVQLPASYEEMFACVASNDWPAVSNLFERIKKSIGQYEGGKPDAALNNEFWQYALEVYGFYEQYANWDADLLDLYARDMIRSIPENAIYFGGTDPGRFVLTAYQAAIGKRFFVITQNALADNLYMDFLRANAAEGLHLPSQDDCQAAFRQYVDDVQAGRTPAGAEVSVENGQVSVKGVQGVMMINGLISRKIFELNKGSRPMVVEESYVIPWMYPYLEPHGVLLQLNPESLSSLSPECVEKDRVFWETCVADLMRRPVFLQDEYARRTFSKLRSAIAGVYAYRHMNDEAIRAFQQALELYPASPEAIFRLADLYVQLQRVDEAVSLVKEGLEKTPAIPQLRPYLNQLLQMKANHQRRMELEEKMKAGSSVEDALELARIYLALNQTMLFEKLVEQILAASDPTGASYQSVAKLCAEARRNDLLPKALTKYVEVKPADALAWYDLAVAYAANKQLAEGLQALKLAVDAGGEEIAQRARDDSHLDALRNDPQFKEIVP